MSQLFLNNFQTSLIANVKSAPETASPAVELDYGVLRVSDGAAGVLLNPGAGGWYIVTAFKRTGTLEHSHEIMRVTTVDNSVVGECRLTVLRGREGTVPTSFSAGDMIELRLTAGAMSEFAQSTDPRLGDDRVPKGPAGGVLSGSYPNPAFAQAMATAVDLNGKVDKVAGKGLSANDFDNAAMVKLVGIEEQATKNALDTQLRDRATHTGAQPISSVTGLQASLDAKVVAVAGKGLSTEDYTTAEKSKLSGVAAGATANATDAQLRDRSTHTGTQAISTIVNLQTSLDSKQPTLVSGTNIKTVNGGSIVGAGDLVISASDPNAVKLTGDQSISGTKVFTAGVRVSPQNRLRVGGNVYSASLNTGNRNWNVACVFGASNVPLYSHFILSCPSRHYAVEVLFSKSTAGAVNTTARIRVLGAYSYYGFYPVRFRVVDLGTNGASSLDFCFAGTSASTEGYELIALEDYIAADRSVPSTDALISYPFVAGGAFATGYTTNNALTVGTGSQITFIEATISVGQPYAYVMGVDGSIGNTSMESNSTTTG
ncbi:hypothetical protein G7048_03475 [Diaphorobacter sp. HDW4B]|uniref:hypothetical protein n=1 Tax=Diaphorobacter sp. HDW4B TaxID=2714925 RepID=UPI001408573B|nr:hypothetical protein [Diaphorobacter sp. HDW4B]QIL68900.1 hypothetical protein G7048_03475 [Diaphorobacter sp. HDW4B]